MVQSVIIRLKCVYYIKYKQHRRDIINNKKDENPKYENRNK